MSRKSSGASPLPPPDAHYADHKSASSSSTLSGASATHHRKNSSLSSTPPEEKLKPGLSLHRSDTSDPAAMPHNSWANIDADTFQVRCGPGYSRYKHKMASGASLYDCISVDLYATPHKAHHLARVIELPNADLSDDEKSDPYLPHTIVVSCQIPNYAVENAVWGRNPEDGAGFSLVFYYALSTETRRRLSERRERKREGRAAVPFEYETTEETEADHKHLYTEDKTSRWAHDDDTDLPPALRLLHRFVTADSDAHTGEKHFLRDRFKGIARIANLDEAQIATAPRKLIQTYNSTPFLIRTTSTFYNDPSGQNQYFEVDVDVHRFGYLARLGLSGVRERIKDVVFDWAFVIEGHTDDELPENILSAARLGHLEMTAALPLPDKFIQHMAPGAS